jgi:hypothetical protein
MNPDNLTQTLERSVLIHAERATVFRYFTDSARFARWWGEGSSIDARPGGAMRIRYPNGIEASVIRRDGKPRHCQGTLLVGWVMSRPDGAEAARGTNVFTMAPDGKIAEAVGIW